MSDHDEITALRAALAEATARAEAAEARLDDNAKPCPHGRCHACSGCWADEHVAREAAEAQVAALVEVLRVSKLNGDLHEPGDWACARCAPHSDILKEGFACAYHRADDLLRDLTTAARERDRRRDEETVRRVHAVVMQHLGEPLGANRLVRAVLGEEPQR